MLPAFAFLSPHTKHLAVRTEAVSPRLAPAPLPNCPGSPAEMVRRDPGGEGKGHGILTTGGWPMPDGKPAASDRKTEGIASWPLPPLL